MAQGVDKDQVVITRRQIVKEILTTVARGHRGDQRAVNRIEFDDHTINTRFAGVILQTITRPNLFGGSTVGVDVTKDLVTNSGGNIAKVVAWIIIPYLVATTDWGTNHRTDIRILAGDRHTSAGAGHAFPNDKGCLRTSDNHTFIIRDNNIGQVNIADIGDNIGPVDRAADGNLRAGWQVSIVTVGVLFDSDGWGRDIWVTVVAGIAVGYSPRQTRGANDGADIFIGGAARLSTTGITARDNLHTRWVCGQALRDARGLIDPNLTGGEHIVVISNPFYRAGNRHQLIISHDDFGQTERNAAIIGDLIGPSNRVAGCNYGHIGIVSAISIGPISELFDH